MTEVAASNEELKLIETAHAILTHGIVEQRMPKNGPCEHAQTRQSLRCSHKQCVRVNEDPDQTLDL